jgi:hypothetical protein
LSQFIGHSVRVEFIKRIVKYWRIIEVQPGLLVPAVFVGIGLLRCVKGFGIIAKKFANTGKICTFNANKAMTG